MFTGIVQGIRKVSGITKIDGRIRLCLKLDDLATNLNHGASVAVNGVCLTVVNVEKHLVEFDVIKESLKRSNLNSLKIDDYVNIERACCLGDEVGGHQVTGHVDCTGKIKQIVTKQSSYDLIIDCEKKWMDYLFSKGWVAIDGISLTIVEVGENFFSVSLIPETIKRTLIGEKKEKDIVNLEFDISTKIIVESFKRKIPEIKKDILEIINH